MSYLDIARAELPDDEGRRTKPYKDSEGLLTIGIGRNLDHKGLSPSEIDFLFGNDLLDADADARAVCQSFDRLSDSRKAVLVNMAFNLGRSRLAGFKRFLAAIEAKAWPQAAAEMGDSKWATQIGKRAVRLASMMRNG